MSNSIRKAPYSGLDHCTICGQWRKLEMWDEGLKGRFCSSIEGGVAAETAELRPVLCRCSSEGVANSSALRAVALVPDALPCDLGKTRRRDFRQVLRYRAASLANECEVFGVTHAKVANRKVKPNTEPFAYGQPAIHRLRQQTCNLLAGRSHLPDPGN